MAKNYRIAVREALVAVLTAGLASADLPYSPAVTKILYRPARKTWTAPAITISDSGASEDDVVPLYRRTLQLDIWGDEGLDQVEAIAQRINALLDHQPLLLPGGEGQVATMFLQSDQDLAVEDADLTRKMLTYTLMVYDYQAPQPFGIGGTVGD